MRKRKSREDPMTMTTILRKIREIPACGARRLRANFDSRYFSIDLHNQSLRGTVARGCNGLLDPDLWPLTATLSHVAQWPRKSQLSQHVIRRGCDTTYVASRRLFVASHIPIYSPRVASCRPPLYNSSRPLALTTPSLSFSLVRASLGFQSRALRRSDRWGCEKW